MKKSVATPVANMFPKSTFVFALLALFAVQSCSALPSQEVDERSLNDIIEQAKKVIEKLSNTVNPIIEGALKKLNAIKDEIIAKAVNIIPDIKHNIDNIIEKVRVEIDKIKEQAENLGDDVKECVEKNSAEIEQLPEKIIDTFKQCIFLGSVDEAIKKVLAIKDEITHLPQNLKACLTNVNPTSCVINLIDQIIKDTTSLPIEIQKIVSQITKLTANLKVTLEKCAAETAIEAAKQAAAIGVEVAKCVVEQN